MNMKMKRTLIALLTASVAASASAVADNQKALQAKADSANAKRGVEIGGSIRAVAQRSSFKTDQDPSGLNQMPDVERNEFVSADLSFGFRPFENVRANIIMRLGGGMQEYFASAAKTLEAKWLNVEGNVGKSFYWTVGDFRSAISPLSIYNPGIDIIYEPTIFARKRHMAQKEQLLEGNKRNLQGVNLQFRQEIDPMVGELRVEAMLARVNRVSVLDLSGAEGNILPNDPIPGATLAANTDKWLAGGNIELLPVNKNVYVGLTPMYIFDNENSKSYTYRHAKVREEENSPLEPDRTPDAQNYTAGNEYLRDAINPYDTTLQKTFVLSARAGADIAGIMQNKNLTLDLVLEYAMSMNKVKMPGIGADPATGAPIEVENEESINGSALLATLNAGYKVDNSWSAGLALDFIRNDEKWFNNLAQSPSFFAQRILNSDKDAVCLEHDPKTGKCTKFDSQVKYGVNSPLYSTFDALYNYSPKFAPVARSLGTDDDAFLAGQNSSYNIALYNKNSWGSNVYSAAQLNLLSMMTDPAIQMALPNGLATANRMGVRAIIKGDWQEKVEGQILVSTFNQVNSVVPGMDKTSYMEIGGGAKIDIAKIAGLGKPMEFSGSFKQSSSKADILPSELNPTPGSAEVKSSFINVGFSAQFLPRVGFTAGFQMINSDYGVTSPNPLVGYDVPLMKSKQTHWMVGFDYTVAENAWLSINYGMINVSNDYNIANLAGAGRNMPDYYTAPEADPNALPATTYTHKFSQSIFEASINVEF